MPTRPEDLFDHHAEEPTTKRINVYDEETVVLDDVEVKLTDVGTTEWVFREPHTATCGHAFFNSIGRNGWGNNDDRAEYLTLVDKDDRQNYEYQSSRVRAPGYTGSFDHRPTDDEIREVIAEGQRLLDEYEAAVARTSPLAAMRDEAPGSPLGVESAEVGQSAWVHAKGKWRRGRVSKVGRSRVTVEYYVVSSGSVTEKAGTAKRPVHSE